MSKRQQEQDTYRLPSVNKKFKTAHLKLIGEIPAIKRWFKHWGTRDTLEPEFEADYSSEYRIKISSYAAKVSKSQTVDAIGHDSIGDKGTESGSEKEENDDNERGEKSSDGASDCEETDSQDIIASDKEELHQPFTPKKLLESPLRQLVTPPKSSRKESSFTRSLEIGGPSVQRNGKSLVPQLSERKRINGTFVYRSLNELLSVHFDDRNAWVSPINRDILGVVKVAIGSVSPKACFYDACIKCNKKDNLCKCGGEPGKTYMRFAPVITFKDEEGTECPTKVFSWKSNEIFNTDDSEKLISITSVNKGHLVLNRQKLSPHFVLFKLSTFGGTIQLDFKGYVVPSVDASSAAISDSDIETIMKAFGCDCNAALEYLKTR